MNNERIISNTFMSCLSNLFFLLAVGFTFFVTTPALSEESSAGLSGFAAVRLHLNDITDADDNRYEVTETFVRSDVGLEYSFGNGFSIEAVVVLEGDPIAGDECSDPADLHDLCDSDNYNADHVMAMEDLILHYKHGPAHFYAGKFTAGVGQSAEDFPGIFTYLTVEEYEIGDRLGLGLAYTMESDSIGSHEVNLSTFFADTSIFADTLITSEGHTSRDDGGLGNTESFDSYALALTGGGFPSLDGLSYQLAYAYQAEGSADKRDVDNPRSTNESRYYVSFAYEHEFNDEWSSNLIAEYVDIDDFDGTDDYDREYTTVGLGLDYHGWNVSAAYTDVSNSDSQEDVKDSDVFQASTAYTFDIGVSVGAGWQRVDLEGEEYDRIGLMLGYELEF